MQDYIPYTITPSALEEVRANQNANKIPEGYFLRVGISGGGCGGAGLVIGFDQVNEYDKIFDFDGVKVLTDKRHFMYLVGVEVDFVERTHERGFVFNKPTKEEE